MTVHNHGTEEGAGLACREIRLHGGLKGECMLDPVLMEVLGQLGDAFYHVRESKGLTQKEAAARIGNTQSKLSYLERGAMDIKLSTLLSFADGLGQKVVIQLVDKESDDGTGNDDGDASVSPRLVDSSVQRPRSERTRREGTSRANTNHSGSRRARAARRADDYDPLWGPPEPLKQPTLLEKFGAK